MKQSILIIIVLTLISITNNSCRIDDYFLLDVTNNTEEEVFLKVNGQTFDRVLPGENKISKDEFEYNTLFHFIAVGLQSGKVRGEIFVTGNEIEYFEWIIN